MNLFLFTNFFPFKKSEPFLVNEFAFTQKYFDTITILSLYGERKDLIELKNSKVDVLPAVLESPSSKFQLFIKGFFNTAGFKFHLRDFFSERLFLSPKKMYWFFISLLITRMALSSKGYKLMLKQINAVENPVLYFYWGDNLCWLIPYLKLKNKKVKIIVRFHRTDLYEYLKNNYAPLRKQIFLSADLLIPISEDGLNYLNEKYPEIRHKLFLSRLGVFDNGLNSYKESDTKSIISVSGLSAVKRVHLIFEALQETKTKIVWHHFGDGPLENELKEKVNKKRDGLEIILHGFVDNKKLMDFYKSQTIDLLMNVSSSEGLPVSIMEAFSFGVPVIATDVGGTAELVNSATGALIKADFTNTELARIIDSVLNLNTADTEVLRKNARNIFEEKVMANKNYMLFYDKIITS